MGVQHVQLGARRRVAHLDPGHEAVALRLGQGIGALHLDRVLGGHHHERRLEQVGRAVDADLALLHRLQHRGLGLRRGAVDLVADHDVGEDAARLELEVAGLGVEDRDPGDVGGQQVGGELDPAYGAVDRAAESLGQHRLADPGHVLDQQVALGEQHDQGQVDRAPLALDDALDRLRGPGPSPGRRRRGSSSCSARGRPPSRSSDSLPLRRSRRSTSAAVSVVRVVAARPSPCCRRRRGRVLREHRARSSVCARRTVAERIRRAAPTRWRRGRHGELRWREVEYSGGKWRTADVEVG